MSERSSPLRPLAVRLRSAICLLGRFPALAGVDFDVAEGEIVLLSGPNGAGKSTLLRVLAGLVPLASGEASVLGHDLARDRRRHRRFIGYLGHETLCYDDLSARENLRFHARAAGRSVDAADHALERVGLTRSASVPHRLLSAGQRRRLALATVLAREPRLLLLDEPHAGLDAIGRELLDTLVTGAATDGRTVILASHELERTRSIAGREVVLAGGYATAGTLPAPEFANTEPSSEERAPRDAREEAVSAR